MSLIIRKKKNKTMRIADYFEKYSFQDVICEFMQLYSINNDRTLSKGKVLAWEKIYKDIQAAVHKLGNVTTNYHVMVMERWERVIPEIDWNCRVCDENNEFQYPFIDALEHQGNEILAMEVIVAGDVELMEKEIAAGLFWELNFYTDIEVVMYLDKHPEFLEFIKNNQNEKI